MVYWLFYNIPYINNLNSEVQMNDYHSSKRNGFCTDKYHFKIILS